MKPAFRALSVSFGLLLIASLLAVTVPTTSSAPQSDCDRRHRMPYGMQQTTSGLQQVAAQRRQLLRDAGEQLHQELR